MKKPVPGGRQTRKSASRVPTKKRAESPSEPGVSNGAPRLETVGERVRYRRLELGLQTHKALVDKIGPGRGVTQQNLSSLEAGNVSNPRNIAALAEGLETTVEWLLTGKGERELRERYRTAAASGGSGSEEPPSPPPPSSHVPLVGVAAAGRWMEPQNEFYESPPMIPRIAVKGKPLATYALRLEGESLNRLVADGSTVFCIRYDEAGMSPATGDIAHVIVRQGQLEEWTLKKLVLHEDGTIELRPQSTDKRWQAPFRFDPKKDKDVTVEVRGLGLAFVGQLGSDVY